MTTDNREEAWYATMADLRATLETAPELEGVVRQNRIVRDSRDRTGLDEAVKTRSRSRPTLNRLRHVRLDSEPYGDSGKTSKEQTPDEL
jgi:hypothetical protein